VATRNNRARIVIADDHTLIAEAFAQVLKLDFEVVAVVNDGKALIDSVYRLNPEVALVDIRMGTPKAMTATAHKLARIIYYMVTTQQEYDATTFQKQEEHRRHQKSTRLHAQARQLGFQLVPIRVVP